jgi:hypothetical protein
MGTTLTVALAATLDVEQLAAVRVPRRLLAAAGGNQVTLSRPGYGST